VALCGISVPVQCGGGSSAGRGKLKQIDADVRLHYVRCFYEIFKNDAAGGFVKISETLKSRHQQDAVDDLSSRFVLEEMKPWKLTPPNLLI
jgi:hypothetical protein